MVLAIIDKRIWKTIMKIFISSTVYDLLDARLEVFHFLQDFGYNVIQSDINDSNFELSHKKSSIEICLENVRNSDYFVLILDRRYGPTLENVGYEKISATHLEYREAMLHKIPILVFIRDRTYGEYTVYKKNPTFFEGTWVSKKDTAIFGLIEEHSKLQEKDKNNWFSLFNSAIDLKQTIHRKLRIPFLRESLAQRIAEGSVPLLSIEHEIDVITMGSSSHQIKFKIRIINKSKSVAFIKKQFWVADGEKPTEINTLMPGEEKTMTFVTKAGPIKTVNNFVLEYSTYDGITIREEHSPYLFVGRGIRDAYLSGVEKVSRNFSIGDPITFDLTE